MSSSSQRSLAANLKSGAVQVLGEVARAVVSPLPAQPDRWLAHGNHLQAQRLMRLSRPQESNGPA